MAEPLAILLLALALVAFLLAMAHGLPGIQVCTCPYDKDGCPMHGVSKLH